MSYPEEKFFRRPSQQKPEDGLTQIMICPSDPQHFLRGADMAFDWIDSIEDNDPLQVESLVWGQS